MRSELITRSQIRSIELYFEGKYQIAHRAGIAIGFDIIEKKWFTAPEWWFQNWQTAYRGNGFGAPQIKPLFKEPNADELEIRNFREIEIGCMTLAAGLLERNPHTQKLRLSEFFEVLSGTLFELWQNGMVMTEQKRSFERETGRLLLEKIEKEIKSWQNDTAEEMQSDQDTENQT